MKTSEYLTFTRKERNGIIALLILLVGVVILSKIRRSETDFVNVALNEDKHEDTTVKNVARIEPAISQKLSNGYKSTPVEYHRKRVVEVIEINSADTSAFIALPGIGSKLASRIVAFRDKLGGFYDVQQIGEVYGLQDSVFKKLIPSLKCDKSKVKKIDVNTADKEALKMHPYIRWSMANVMVNYREEHGTFKSGSDLERLENIDQESLNKMLPYLSFK